MKKIIGLFIAVCCFFSGFSQNIVYPKPAGKYKFSLGEEEIYLYLSKDGRFSFRFSKYPYFGASEDEAAAYEVKGNYASSGDLFRLTPDPEYSEYSVRYVRSDKPASDRLTVRFENISVYEDHRILIADKLAASEGIRLDSLSMVKSDITEITSDDISPALFTMTFEKADSLYIIKPHHYETEVSAYPIPKNTTEIIVMRGNEFNFTDLDFRYGENQNELVLFLKNTGYRTIFGSSVISLFFIDSKIEPNVNFTASIDKYAGHDHLFGIRSVIPIEKEYQITEVIEADDFPEEQLIAVIPSSEYPDLSVPEIITSYKKATKKAKKENKYLIVYREPTSSENESGLISFQKKITSRSSEETDKFNRNFIICNDRENTTKIFDKYGISDSLACIILSPDNHLIYSCREVYFHKLFNSEIYRDATLVKNLLDLHYLNTILTPELEKKKEPTKKESEYYFSIFIQCKEDERTNRFLRKSDKAHFSDLNLTIDTCQALSFFDTLVEKYYYPKPDSVNLYFTNEILNFLQGKKYDIPVYRNDRLTPVFRYLCKALEKNTVPKKGYLTKDLLFSELTEYAIGRAFYHDGDEEDLNTLFYLFMQEAPTTKMLFMPFITSVFNAYKGDDVINVEIQKAAETYLDESVDPKKVRSDFDRLYSTGKEELLYMISRVGFIDKDDFRDIINEDKQKQTLYNSYMIMVNELFNAMAWYCYLYTDDENLREKALLWSNTSLRSNPDNPYFLDTNARLLYKAGKRQEAISQQEKAVIKLNDVKDVKTRINMKSALVKMKNEK